MILPRGRGRPAPPWTSSKSSAGFSRRDRAVHVAGPVDGRTVLVQGGAGAVGQCAVALARHAARALNTILEGEWPGFEIEGRFPLESIAAAHEAIEQRKVSGRVVVNP